MDNLYIIEYQYQDYGKRKVEVRRKAKIAKCLECGYEWLIRLSRKSPPYCKSCKMKGEKNHRFGKEPHNKGKITFDPKAYNRDYQNQVRHERKKEVVKYFGNKCYRCGEKNLPLCVWHFHHKIEEKKTIAVSQILTYSYKSMYDELKKCIMVCSNCHYIIHRGDERLENG